MHAGLLPGSAVAWTVVAVKRFQSFYYVENRAPMSSSDVTGLLIGLPKAGFIFLYNAPFSRERVSALLNTQNTRLCAHTHTHTIMFTLGKRASVRSQTPPTPTHTHAR